jgi:hypothetical protein
MKKSLQDIKDFFPIGKNFSIIINVDDYTFRELLDMAKMTALVNWKFTFKNAGNLSVAELQQLLTHAENKALTFDFS